MTVNNILQSLPTNYLKDLTQVFWLLYYIGDWGQIFFCLPRGLPARRLRGWHAFYYLIYSKRLDMGRSRKWGVPDQHVHRVEFRRQFSHVNSSFFLKISQQLQAEHLSRWGLLESYMYLQKLVFMDKSYFRLDQCRYRAVIYLYKVI